MKMKKTLHTGLAVMALCALLASCGEKEMSSGLSAYSAPLSVTQVTAIATIPTRDNRTQLAKNGLHGYLTETEYGDIENLNEVTADKGNTGNDTVVTTVKGTESTSVYTLDTLTPNQNSIFEEKYDNMKSFVDGGGDAEDILEMVQEELDWEIQAGTLPDNAKTLFDEYLHNNGFFEEQNNNNTGSSHDSGNTGNQGSGNTGSQTDNSSNDNSGQQNYTPPVQNETAPQPSYEQQQGSQDGKLRDLSVEEQQRLNDEALKEFGYETGGGLIDISGLL